MCLSVKQPWATAIVHGPKRVDSRSWHTTYAGPIAIHAARRGDLMVPNVLEYIRSGWPQMPSVFPVDSFGAIVGTATLTACLRPSNAIRKHPDQRHWIDDGSYGAWCFVLSDAVALSKPIQWREPQGLRYEPQELWCEPSLRKIIKEQCS